MNKAVITDKAPAALGPYSAGVEVTGSSKTVYVSGQIPVVRRRRHSP